MRIDSFYYHFSASTPIFSPLSTVIATPNFLPLISLHNRRLCFPLVRYVHNNKGVLDTFSNISYKPIVGYLFYLQEIRDQPRFPRPAHHHISCPYPPFSSTINTPLLYFCSVLESQVFWLVFHNFHTHRRILTLVTEPSCTFSGLFSSNLSMFWLAYVTCRDKLHIVHREFHDCYRPYARGGMC